MRQLLLTALGAAGSLLMGLPALAQLSTDTSTFSGNIAATCSISLPQNISLAYQANNTLFASGSVIQISTNFEGPQIVIDRLTVVEEPPAEQGKTIRAIFNLFEVVGGVVTTAQASKSLGSSSTRFSVQPNNPTDLSHSIYVNTFETDESGNYLLPDGRYAYRATISCLHVE